MKAAVYVEPSSVAANETAGLMAALEQTHSWQLDSAGAQGQAISLVVADTVQAASALASRAASPIIFVGVAGDGFGRPGSEPRPGSIPELLEQTNAIGVVVATAQRPSPSQSFSFIGRKDVMERLGMTCFKAMQSDNYCLWIEAPDTALPEFLSLLAGAVAEATS